MTREACSYLVIGGGTIGALVVYVKTWQTRVPEPPADSVIRCFSDPPAAAGSVIITRTAHPVQIVGLIL